MSERSNNSIHTTAARSTAHCCRQRAFSAVAAAASTAVMRARRVTRTRADADGVVGHQSSCRTASKLSEVRTLWEVGEISVFSKPFKSYGDGQGATTERRHTDPTVPTRPSMYPLPTPFFSDRSDHLNHGFERTDGSASPPPQKSNLSCRFWATSRGGDSTSNCTAGTGLPSNARQIPVKIPSNPVKGSCSEKVPLFLLNSGWTVHSWVEV